MPIKRERVLKCNKIILLNKSTNEWNWMRRSFEKNRLA